MSDIISQLIGGRPFSIKRNIFVAVRFSLARIVVTDRDFCCRAVHGANVELALILWNLEYRRSCSTYRDMPCDLNKNIWHGRRCIGPDMFYILFQLPRSGGMLLYTREHACCCATVRKAKLL